MIHWEGHITSVIFLLNKIKPQSYEDTPEKCKLNVIPWDGLPVVFQYYYVERHWKTEKLTQTGVDKGNMTTKCHVTWDPRQGFGTEIGLKFKNWLKKKQQQQLKRQ